MLKNITLFGNIPSPKRKISYYVYLTNKIATDKLSHTSLFIVQIIFRSNLFLYFWILFFCTS